MRQKKIRRLSSYRYRSARYHRSLIGRRHNQAILVIQKGANSAVDTQEKCPSDGRFPLTNLWHKMLIPNGMSSRRSRILDAEQSAISSLSPLSVVRIIVKRPALWPALALRSSVSQLRYITAQRSLVPVCIPIIPFLPLRESR